MKNTDKLADVLQKANLTDFFAVTGGAAVHIIDSLMTRGNLNAIFHHHEQAAALAADAYARVRNLGVCVVTTGPGVTNAMTGLLCSWQDSVPTLFISGQARHSQTSLGSNVRQVGTQHLEVVPLVKHMTKKAVMIKPGDDMQAVVEELIEIAQESRKGPVWLDIPLDLQIAEYSITNEPILQSSYTRHPSLIKSSEIESIKKELRLAKSPIILLGRGMTDLSQHIFEEIVKKLNVPCLRTWGFFDSNLIVPEYLDCGVVGVSGQRGANKLIAESDLVLSFGARWGQAVVGPIIDEFAPTAKIHLIDIDKFELEKTKEFLPNAYLHHGHAGRFFHEISSDFSVSQDRSLWQKYCLSIKEFNLEQVLELRDEQIDQYYLFSLIDKMINSNSTIVIDGGGTIVYCSMQILRKIPDRKILIPSASAPMGTGIPHAIGAQVALKDKNTILICGDGSFPFNIQELQTIRTNALPIKIVVVNNNGYLSIQGTQNQFLGGRHFGSSEDCGLELPNLHKVVPAFGITYIECRSASKLKEKIEQLMTSVGPAILEVFIRRDQEIYPRTRFHKEKDGRFSPLPLRDMHPKKEMASFQKDIT